jgi:DNA-binding transcriptional LysR family regulator
VGAELFVRRPRGVTATAFGEILIDHARSVLGSLRRASEQIQEVRRTGARPLRVGTNLAGAYALLPRAIVAVKRERPHASISVIEGGAEQLNTSLARSEVDLVVGRLDAGVHRGALHHIRLYDEAVRLVVRRGHPALDTPDLPLAELLRYPWILPLRPTQLRTELDEVFALQGVDLPTDVIECSTILTLRSILLETDAIAPLPTLIGLRDELLDMLPTPLDTVPRAIGVTLPADRSVSGSARLLVDALRSTATQIADELRTGG